MDKTNSATRVLRLIKTLKGHSLTGLSNGELAEALKDSPTNVSRAMALLIQEGMATKLENGRFALSVQMLQIAVAYTGEMQRAKDKITQLEQRVNTALY